MTENNQRNGLGGLLTTTRLRVVLSHSADWRDVVYTPEIDSLLATLALEDENPAVAEAAARAIGRIRSEAAVKVLAERQKAGNRRALRALALVRDEAPSLPKSVSRQARLYTWLNNTWRRITDQPLKSITRYLLGALFGAVAIWWYAYSNISSAAIFFAERIGTSLTSGVTVGVIVGLIVLLGAEVPERLRGFWPWWARLLLSLILGFLAGVLLWVFWTWFVLFYAPDADSVNALIVGGIGAAVAFALGAVFRIPGWLGAVWAALSIYAALYVTWVNYMPPLLYTRPGEDISKYGLPIAIMIGVGAYLPGLIGDARGLWRRFRQRSEPQAQPAATAAS